MEYFHEEDQEFRRDGCELQNIFPDGKASFSCSKVSRYFQIFIKSSYSPLFKSNYWVFHHLANIEFANLFRNRGFQVTLIYFASSLIFCWLCTQFDKAQLSGKNEV